MTATSSHRCCVAELKLNPGNFPGRAVNPYALNFAMVI